MLCHFHHLFWLFNFLDNEVSPHFLLFLGRYNSKTKIPRSRRSRKFRSEKFRSQKSKSRSRKSRLENNSISKESSTVPALFPSSTEIPAAFFILKPSNICINSFQILKFFSSGASTSTSTSRAFRFALH